MVFTETNRLTYKFLNAQAWELKWISHWKIFSANEEGEKGVDPAEDKPLGATVEAPTVIETTKKALNVTATQQPDQKPVSLSQELLAAAAVPAAISQEVIFSTSPTV